MNKKIDEINEKFKTEDIWIDNYESTIFFTDSRENVYKLCFSTEPSLLFYSDHTSDTGTHKKVTVEMIELLNGREFSSLTRAVEFIREKLPKVSMEETQYEDSALSEKEDEEAVSNLHTNLLKNEIASRSQELKISTKPPVSKQKPKIIRILGEYTEFMATYKDPEDQFKLTFDEENVTKCTVAVNWLNEDSLLNSQLKEYKKNNPGETLQLEITYPEDYPFEPPFVRILSPLLFNGHVHHGGAICLEFLTKDKWCPSWSLESVIIQVTSALANPLAGTRILPCSKQRIEQSNSVSRAKAEFESIQRNRPWLKIENY